MHRTLALTALLLALIGCQPEVATSSGGGLTAAERAECLAQGGRVGQGGIIPDPICIMPLPDAGKACKKASDCAGTCMADTMTCSPVSPLFGCFGIIEEDGRRVDLCVD